MDKVANMKTKPSSRSRVLGGKKFAAIAAVEGLKLSPAAKKRIAAMRAKKLSPDQRRAEVLRAYVGAKGS
jgi:hypothetical protein